MWARLQMAMLDSQFNQGRPPKWAPTIPRSRQTIVLSHLALILLTPNSYSRAEPHSLRLKPLSSPSDNS
jgi:hypothetical protein